MFQVLPTSHASLPAFLRAGPAVHELRAPVGTAGHVGLAVLILASFRGERPVLWVSTASDWYPPGLAWAGIDAAHCLFAQAGDDTECLSTLETALRGGMAGVGECKTLSRLGARRLALAAKQGNGLGLVLRHAPAHAREDSTAFASRWMVHPAPGNPRAARLRATLLYAKGAMPGEHIFELGEEQNGATPMVVAPLRRTG
jgi:protein ImuA